MKIDGLVNISFNEVHLNLIFDHIKGINKNKYFNPNNIEEATCIDSLRHMTIIHLMKEEYFLQLLCKRF